MRIIGALLLTAGALVLAQPAAAVAPAGPKPVTFMIAVGKKGVVGGPKKLMAKRGQRVTLVIVSALTGTVHVHGYDIERPVRAGGTARISFTATITGRFVIELHGNVHLPIGELEVRP